MRGRITNKAVEALKPGEVLWDTALAGFGVRRVKHRPVYCVKYRFNGRSRWLSIGPHGQGWKAAKARDEALRLLTMIRVEKRDPAEERDRSRGELTVSQFCDRFLDDYAERKVKASTFREYRRQCKVEIKPALGSLRLSGVTRSDVQKLHHDRRKTPMAANRILATLSVMFNVAEKWGMRPEGSNPCRHVAKFPEKKRERLVTPEELGRLGDALNAAERNNAEDWRTIAAIRLLALTGARRMEILTLKWDYIDAKRGIARLPDSKTGARNISLPPPALAILDALPRFEDNSYVLPSDRPGGHYTGLSHQWARIKKAATLDGLRIHDLRHAFASTAVASGESLYITGKMLGHKVPATTERYAHLAPDPIAAVAKRTAKKIATAMKGRGA